MGDSDINSLIGPIGDRLRLKSNLEIWKNELTSASSEFSSSPLPELSSSFLNEINPPSPSTLANTEQQWLNENSNNEVTLRNSVLEILNQKAEGRAILIKGNNGLLSYDLRKQLAHIIIKTILENEPRKAVQGPYFLKLAHEIHELFPQESPAVYYAPYLAQTKFQAKRNASGILYNAYTTRKKHLRNLGLLPHPARSQSHSRATKNSSTNNTPEFIIPGSGIQISELQRDDPAVSEEHLTVLESPDPGPWQEVEKCWNSTVCARLRYLYYEKGTLFDYLNRFPILKSPSGFSLLLQDYTNLYPNNTTGMTNLLSVSKKIIQIAAARASTTTDASIKKSIQGYIDAINENNEEDVSLLVLPYIINIPPVRRKGAWKPSRAEFRDGFIMKAPTDAEVRPILAERRNKLLNLGVTFQPVVIYCGDTVSNITKAYAVCDDVLYEFRSLTKAVDVAFKVFHATGAQYPQESYDVWLLLQIALYNLNTQFDRQSASLKQVLVDLGFKNKIK